MSSRSTATWCAARGCPLPERQQLPRRQPPCSACAFGASPAVGRPHTHTTPPPTHLPPQKTPSRQVTGATVSEKANLGWTVRYTLQFDDDVEVEYTVTREQADGPLGLDIGQRIYLYVKPEAMMGFEPEDIDSAPVL